MRPYVDLGVPCLRIDITVWSARVRSIRPYINVREMQGMSAI